jgi:hypothetical protein
MNLVVSGRVDTHQLLGYCSQFLTREQAQEIVGKYNNVTVQSTTDSVIQFLQPMNMRVVKKRIHNPPIILRVNFEHASIVHYVLYTKKGA